MCVVTLCVSSAQQNIVFAVKRWKIQNICSFRNRYSKLLWPRRILKYLQHSAAINKNPYSSLRQQKTNSSSQPTQHEPGCTEMAPCALLFLGSVWWYGANSSSAVDHRNTGSFLPFFGVLKRPNVMLLIYTKAIQTVRDNSHINKRFPKSYSERII